jgi:hypothetical protein
MSHSATALALPVIVIALDFAIACRSSEISGVPQDVVVGPHPIISGG